VSREVLARESDALVDTDIQVNRGDTAMFHAWGQIWAGVWLTGLNRPDGWTNIDNDPKFPLPGAHPYCLLGVLDNGPLAAEVACVGRLLPRRWLQSRDRRGRRQRCRAGSPAVGCAARPGPAIARSGYGGAWGRARRERPVCCGRAAPGRETMQATTSVQVHRADRSNTAHRGFARSCILGRRLRVHSGQCCDSRVAAQLVQAAAAVRADAADRDTQPGADLGI